MLSVMYSMLEQCKALFLIYFENLLWLVFTIVVLRARLRVDCHSRVLNIYVEILGKSIHLTAPVLHRCANDAGCCPSERQSCAPKHIKIVDLYFFSFSNTFGITTNIDMKVHSKWKIKKEKL
uniref:Platelet-derived growth factor (PDGF) family profile domain-containing protein n=1 Tax=Glossina austeni TaxID=7395 RepID=A0A1A9UZ57_GLOAU